MSIMTAQQRWMSIINETYNTYMQHGGSRSPAKVNYFHGKIKEELELIFTESKGYSVKLECKIPSRNLTGYKRCDIVVFKNDKTHIIFPVKLIMTNYKQNKASSFENITGELFHLSKANPDVNIVPINIFMNKTPYRRADGTIKSFENITSSDILGYNMLKEDGLCFDMKNYIIDVEHKNIIGEQFIQTPDLLGFNEATPFRSFDEIFATT